METSTPALMIPDNDLYNDTLGLNTNVSDHQGSYWSPFEELLTANTVYMSILMSIEIPMICLAIYAVCVFIKSNQAAPVLVINLLISDLIQMVAFVIVCVYSWQTFANIVFFWLYFVGVYFMMCIAIERYVLIAHPVWHRNHSWGKCFVCTSLTGWLLPLIITPLGFIDNALPLSTPLIFYIVIFLCFVGSCRSVSRSVSLTPLKKQLVLATLFFVLLSYTFLILPFNIIWIIYLFSFDFHLNFLQHCMNLYMLNPLTDSLLYVFMRSDAENIIRTPHCCSRANRNQTETRHTTSTDAQTDHV